MKFQLLLFRKNLLIRFNTNVQCILAYIYTKLSARALRMLHFEKYEKNVSRGQIIRNKWFRENVNLQFFGNSHFCFFRIDFEYFFLVPKWKRVLLNLALSVLRCVFFCIINKERREFSFNAVDTNCFCSLVRIVIQHSESGSVWMYIGVITVLNFNGSVIHLTIFSHFKFYFQSVSAVK